MSRKVFYTLFVFGVAMAGLAGCSHRVQPPDVGQVLSTFEVADGFEIELIAAEPLIGDPVAMEIDELGRMFVVEMHGYPLDMGGSGFVKMLTDSDGDGVMDRSVEFAANLQFPTGVMRWKKGIIVTDPPNVLYFEDKDGDGIADVRDTVLTGFALSNPQHNLNNPIYGIDNWIYVSNEPATTAKVFVDEFGDLGSEVHFHGRENGPRLPQNAGGRRIRFKPAGYELEALSSASQFGHTYDRYGRQLLVSNANHIYQEVIQAKYLNRNPDLLIASAVASISDHGAAADVYPITKNPEHQLLTDLGVFTAACGITAYNGGLFPAPFDSVVFVAEPVGNLVHADLVRGQGVELLASRVYENREFLASTDAWFRPVNQYVGPDGALYVVDYHRRIIEHPEWMAEGAEKSPTLYDGRDKGRIFRIVPKGTGAASWTKGLDLTSESLTVLVDMLSHKNGWYRRNAQRILIDRSEQKSIALIRKALRSELPAYGVIHAAWTLSGLGALDAETVEMLLRHEEGGVVENGIILAETLLEGNNGVLEELLHLQDHPSARVRFQLMCSLGYSQNDRAAKTRESLLFREIDNSWMQIAALSANSPEYAGLLSRAVAEFDMSKPAYEELIQRLAGLSIMEMQGSEVGLLIEKALSSRDRHNGVWQSALLRGIDSRGEMLESDNPIYGPYRTKLLSAVFEHPYMPVRSAALGVLSHLKMPIDGGGQAYLERARRQAIDQEAHSVVRKIAIDFLIMAKRKEFEDELLKLLNPTESLEIQRTVLKALNKGDAGVLHGWLTANWKSLSPSIREAAISTFFGDQKRISLLLDALENGAIDPSIISWPRQVSLMANADASFRSRARVLFDSKVDDQGKQALLDGYFGALDSLQGDVKTGRLVFERSCSACHQIGGNFGQAYGPDLASIRTRRPQAIIKDILDPGASIADGYEMWELTMASGEVRQGIIGSETPTSVNLRVMGAADEVIARRNIASIRAIDMSVMPPGLENQLSAQDMVDLLTFINKLN